MSGNSILFPATINEHAIGIIMKEMSRRAVLAIRRQRLVFEAQAKIVEYKEGEDLVTSADNAAQAIYVKTLRECFPGFGLIAEEDNLRWVGQALSNGEELYFTVDALDGTKAFARRQSHGIATMISLCLGGRVIAAFIGDVMTQELYGFRPGSSNVWRFHDNVLEGAEKLPSIDPAKSLGEQYVLLRDRPTGHTSIIQCLANHKSLGGIFREIEISGGSIGCAFARLWKGEVGALVLKAGTTTPWDWNPVAGISEQMGFSFALAKQGEIGNFTTTWPAIKEFWTPGGDMIIIHRSRIQELLGWHQKLRKAVTGNIA